MKKTDKEFAGVLAIDAACHFNFAKFTVWSTLDIDKPKTIKNFALFGEMLLYAYKRGEAAARAADELAQPLEPADVTHIEIRATKTVSNGVTNDVAWCTEEEAEDYSVYRGAPGRFNWVADFGEKDNALEYAETLGKQHDALVSNRIGEV